MKYARTKPVIVACAVTVLAAPAAADFFGALAGALSWTAELAVLLASKQPHLKDIYLTHFGADGPAGTVHPKLTVAADGNVNAVVMEEDTFGDAAFAAALEREILTWQMPETTYNMTLGFDLEFDPRRDLYGVGAKVGNDAK